MQKKTRFDKPVLRKMTVKCLGLDYDGTVSPFDISRTESYIPEKTRETLQQISQLIPIVIITAKDLSFATETTPFAHAWFAISGLEAKIGDKILKPSSYESRLKNIHLAIEYARSNCTDKGIEIEEKQDSKRRTVAFCLDWRRAKDFKKARQEANHVAAYCEALQLELKRSKRQPFYDVYPISVDKGAVLGKVRKELKLKKGILFMGDSEVDNPAFEASDLGLGVIHGETPLESLVCDYLVKFEDVASFLSMLLENRLIFRSDFPMVEVNNKGLQRQ